MTLRKRHSTPPWRMLATAISTIPRLNSEAPSSFPWAEDMYEAPMAVMASTIAARKVKK